MYWRSWPFLPGESIEERAARIDVYLADRRAANPASVRSKTTIFVRKNGIQRQPCCVCGDPNGHMHHPDYKYWYLIAFLCPKHHMKEHHKQLDVPIKIHDLRSLVAA